MLKTSKLGRDSKLTTAESFHHVFKNARRFRQDGLSVLACRNNLTSSRVGISVPKKQVPRAVDRNRIKRIIRESFRVKKEELKYPLDMVFLAYSAVLELSNQEIRTCLDFLWLKLISFYNKV